MPRRHADMTIDDIDVNDMPLRFRHFRQDTYADAKRHAAALLRRSLICQPLQLLYYALF